MTKTWVPVLPGVGEGEEDESDIVGRGLLVDRLGWGSWCASSFLTPLSFRSYSTLSSHHRQFDQIRALRCLQCRAPPLPQLTSASTRMGYTLCVLGLSLSPRHLVAPV